MMARFLADAVAVHKALAHQARLRIVAMLRSGELCVCQITAVLGVATSTVSAHLSELRRAGLVAERKDGRWVYYSLTAGVAGDDGPVDWAALGGDRQLADDAALVAKLRELGPEEVCRNGFDVESLDCEARATTTITKGRPA